MACRDPDPDGVQLAATADPLGEASKLMKRLCGHAGESLGTHLLAFEVRRLAWSCICVKVQRAWATHLLEFEVRRPAL